MELWIEIKKIKMEKKIYEKDNGDEGLQEYKL